jgi:hypothetical protein
LVFKSTLLKRDVPTHAAI